MPGAGSGRGGGKDGDGGKSGSASSGVGVDEMNREQAERCVRLAVAAEEKGDVAKAVRLFEKSLRMCEIPGVRGRLERLQSGGGEDGDGGGGTMGDSPSLRRRKPPSSRTASPSPPPTPTKSHSPELVALIRTVRSAKSHYDVLGVPNTASASQIKKAYRKLALKLHPDKCDAPGGEEAFKKLGGAAAVLMDAEKKRRYDLTGMDEDEAQAAAAAQQRAQYGRGGFMTPEEQAERIFEEMFFGHGMGGGGMAFGVGRGGGMRFHVQRGGGMRGGRGGGRGGGGGGDPAWRVVQLLQFLPILLLFLLAFSSLLSPQNSPPFLLQANHPFTVRMKTRGMGGVVPDLQFYVTSHQASQYRLDPRLRAKVERQVERETKNHLTQACSVEREIERQLKEASSMWRKHSLRNKLAMYKGSCREFDKLLEKKRADEWA